MLKSTMLELGIKMSELSKTRMVIREFSLESQRAIGIVRVDLTMGELTTPTLFHVIDAKASFKLLLGLGVSNEQTGSRTCSARLGESSIKARLVEARLEFELGSRLKRAELS